MGGQHENMVIYGIMEIGKFVQKYQKTPIKLQKSQK